ncbi:Aste57867_1550 [Aphanomyces stellatus]|uniref:Aste57867_1550 protein n=1 Tax=Aphanomyces stellatus TaxID=120398 RepID=A0A485KAX1_9STRA|nr:hypothetical protein As57867_001549 [Aphanomyces stellatus]VFT78764.1 Aste57867_1550 [Aphanomyces stellatus]
MTLLTLFCPSATHLPKFQTVSAVTSAVTSHWVVPPQTVTQALLDVAAIVVETDAPASTNAPPPSRGGIPILAAIFTDERLPTAADVAAYLGQISPSTTTCSQ